MASVDLIVAEPVVILPSLVLAVDYFLLKGRDIYMALLVAALAASVILFGVHPQIDARYHYYQLALIPTLVLLIHTKTKITREQAV